jgi:molybdate transport system ATP-binding protein
MADLHVGIRKRLSAEFDLNTTFSIQPGFTLLFGVSGAGKTTLLNCIAGLTRPDAGAITLGGRRLFDSTVGIDVAVPERHVGYVFQTLALFPHCTAEGNIRYGIVDQPEVEQRERTGEIMESFRISHVAQRRPGQISGGERQRVALARSLVTEPELLLLDEPLTGLDRTTKLAIVEDLGHWNQGRQIPVLFVTHSSAEARLLAQRALVLANGRIIGAGNVEDILGPDAQD